MKVEEHSNKDERKILTAMIVNDHVVARIAAHYEKQLFESPWANLVAGWCVKFHSKYDKAPGVEIEAMFDRWAPKPTHDKATVQIVRKFLEGLSDEYSRSREINVEHTIDRAASYFNRVRIGRLGEKLKDLASTNQVEEAEEAVDKYRQVEFGGEEFTDPYSQLDIHERTFSYQVEEMIEYPGELGRGFFREQLARDCFVAFQAPMKRQKCVAGSTKVLLANGALKSIASIVKKKKPVEILSLNTKTQNVERICIAQFWDNGTKPTFEIRTRSGKRVVTTANHKYYTPNGWMKLEDLHIGDFIAVPKRVAVFGERQMSDAEVKFIAYMLAEGCCVQTHFKGKKWGCASTFTNGETSVRDDFKSCCTELGIGFADAMPMSIRIDKVGKRLLRRYRILGHSAKSKLIPKEIFQLPKNKLALFLQVFFSCDGSIGNDSRNGIPKVRLSLANESMIRQLSHLLIRFGIVHRMFFSPTTFNEEKFDAWQITIGSAEYVNLFLNEINFLPFKSCGWRSFDHKRRSFMDRIPCAIVRTAWEEIKKEGRGALVHWFGKSRTKQIAESLRCGRDFMRESLRDCKHAKIQQILDSDILWDPIVSIKAAGRIHTYDIGVPMYHNFIGDDCFIHNSFWLFDIVHRGLMNRRRVAYFQIGDMSEHQVTRRQEARLCYRPLKAGKWMFPVKLIPSRATGFKVKRERRFEREPLSLEDIRRAQIEFRDLYLRSNRPYLRMLVRPTMSLDDIRARLLRLEMTEEFVPDIVVIDYADLLEAPKGFREKRDQINENWRRLRTLSQELHCLVVTATQANSKAHKLDKQGRSSFSDNQLKQAHVTAMIGINSTPDELKQDVARLEFVVVREGPYREGHQVYVANCLKIANPAVRSCKCQYS